MAALLTFDSMCNGRYSALGTRHSVLQNPMLTFAA